METQTQQMPEFKFPDLAQVMATAEMQQRMDEAEERVRQEKLAKAQEAQNSKTEPKAEGKQGAVSPRNGQPVPQGPGRTPGVKNRLTNLRDAVLEAFDEVGGPAYLARLAQGTSSDRAAFVGLVSKVLPTQINANVEGGIQVQLSWLGGRNIGTTVAQPVEEVTQVVDLERDSAGKYRIKDPVDAVAPAGGGAAAIDDQGKTAQNDAGDAQGA
jgi:hypothetical protein